MAAPAENLLSYGYRTRTRENTFTKQREQCVKESRAMHVQQRLEELKDREHQAQRHNKQLLQQFEKAQDALEEMLARNAAMKTIRMEYERYLEENSTRWQQQLQETAQKKRMEDCSRLYQKKSEEKEVLTSTLDGSLSHDPSMLNKKCVASHENSDYHQSSFSHHPFPQLTSTQTHTGRFPGFLTGPHQSHSPFFFPPPNVLHPHSFLLQHPTSSLGQYQPWSKQEASDRDPGSWTAGIPPGSVGRLHTENPPSNVSVRERNETNTSKEKDDGGGLSPDLDVKPVRLSSGHAESSGSSGGSSLAGRDKRRKKKRGRVQRSSSDSQKSSNKVIFASLAAAQNSEINSSSEGSDRSSSSTRRGEAPVGSPQPEGGAETRRREEDRESQHSDEESSLSKKVENQSHDDKSESCRAEESDRDVENQTRAEEETDNQEGSSDEERGDEGETKDLETGDEENSQKSEEQDSDVEGDEDGEHQEAEEQLNKNKDTKTRKKSSASSQDEEDESEEDEESNKEDKSEEAEDSCDSDDVIISPQDKRSEQMQVIPDDEDEVKTQSSDEDDIENLLAPPEGAKKAEMDKSADEEPKAVCHNMNIFQVMDKSKVDRVSDSDEFDHFYD